MIIKPVSIYDPQVSVNLSLEYKVDNSEVFEVDEVYNINGFELLCHSSTRNHDRRTVIYLFHGVS